MLSAQDPLNVQHQLLSVFVGSYLLDAVTAGVLCMRGWCSDHIVYQGHTFIYWRRHTPHAAHTAAPLVFLHGIGVGYEGLARVACSLVGKVGVCVLDNDVHCI